MLEVLVTAAILAILVAVALPSYRQYIVRTNRVAAQAQMMDIANREEQHLLANRAYAGKAALQAGGYALPPELSALYDFDVTLGDTPPSYTITFSPKGSQAGDGPLSLTNTGVKSPAGKW